MKKIISGIMALVMTLLVSVNCFAYLAGDKFINLNLADCSKYSGVEIKSDSLVSFQPGGKAVYDLYIPFNAVKVDFYYSVKGSGNLTMYIDNIEYKVPVSGMYNFFSLGKKVVRNGQHKITFVSDIAFDLNKVQIYKEDTDVAPQAPPVAPALNEFEKAVQTAIILHENSPVIMVNGGRRYVNNDNVRETPYIVNGEAYLPLHSFARAFGYYYEQTEDTVLLSKEDIVYVLKNGVLKKQENYTDFVEINNIIIQNEWGTFVPIRYFAEIDGKTVAKKDGFYIVEYLSNTKDIMEADIFEELLDFYSGLYLEENTGRTYYVCQKCNASDDNDGSKEHPFRTIAKAAEVAQAGDTVIIGEGVYYEILAPKNDGTASRPITFKAAEGADVELCATAQLGAPIETTADGKLVYEALTDLGHGRNQIFYKRENLVAGRHPNTHTVDRPVPDIENLSPVWPTQGNIKVTLENSKIAASDTDLNQENDYWKGGILVALTGNGWSLGSAEIEKSEPGKLYLTNTTTTWWFAAKEAYTKTDFGFITDHINTVDLPGEWAYQDGKIYIIPPEGETAETLKLEQKVRQLAIDIADRKHIIIEGINTYGGGMRMNTSEMCMLRDGEYRYISHYTHGMDQREGFIDKRDIYNPEGAPPRGEMGIYVGGRDNIIINNHIAYSAAAGIYATGLYEYIENNVISDCGYMGSYVGGLFIGTDGWQERDTPRGGNAIFKNTVYNSGRYVYGLSSTESWYVGGTELKLPAFLPDEVAYNEFYNGSICTRDVGTTYVHGATIGTDRLRSKFHNNVVYDSWSFDSFNCGVYYDNWMSGAECYDNVVFYTDERIEPRWAYYYQLKSSFPVSFANIDNWNNMDAGFVPEGKEAIDRNSYPNGRKFQSGADAMQTMKAPMIESLEFDDSWYTPSEMKYSEGVKLVDGRLKPTVDGDWICIENVDFSDGKNQITIEFTGDIYEDTDVVDLVVGSSVNGKSSGKINLKTHSAYFWGANTASGFIEPPNGVSNVWIRFSDYKSVQIKKVTIDKVYNAYSENTNIYAHTGTIEKAVNGTAIADYTAFDEFNPFINNTWDGTVISYKDVELKDDSDTLSVQLASKMPYNTSMMEVRLGSADGEVIATYDITVKKDWTDYTLDQVPLSRTLEKGIYDIYVTFKGNGSCNFYYFGFSKSQ